MIEAIGKVIMIIAIIGLIQFFVTVLSVGLYANHVIKKNKGGMRTAVMTMVIVWISILTFIPLHIYIGEIIWQM